MNLRQTLCKEFSPNNPLDMLRLLLVCMALQLIFNSFGVLTLPATYADSEYLTRQIQNPLTPLDSSDDPTGHYEKIAFRFVPPLLAHWAGLDLTGLMYLQVILGYVFPLLVWRVLFNATESSSWSTKGTLLLNGLYCSHAFFIDSMFFDPFAYLFLALAMLSSYRVLIVVFLLCAAFTDERALIASFSILVWHWYRADDFNLAGVIRQLSWYVPFVVAYFGIRSWLGTAYGLSTGVDGVSLLFASYNLKNIVLLIWSVFEGGWLVIYAAAALLIANIKRTQADTETGRFQFSSFRPDNYFYLLAAATVALVTVFFFGLLVGDALRSQQYSFPVLLLATVVLAKQNARLNAWYLALILTLLTPIYLYMGFRVCNCGHDVYFIVPVVPGYTYLYDVLVNIIS